MKAIHEMSLDELAVAAEATRGRPRRPNVEGRGKRGQARMSTHVKQETREERKSRLRLGAQLRGEAARRRRSVASS